MSDSKDIVEENSLAIVVSPQPIQMLPSDSKDVAGSELVEYYEQSGPSEALEDYSSTNSSEEEKLEESDSMEDESNAASELWRKKKWDPGAQNVSKKKFEPIVHYGKAHTKRKSYKVSCSESMKKKKRISEGVAKQHTRAKKDTFRFRNPQNERWCILET